MISGALAGGGARYGRLCTMGAIEDALVGRDFRAAKAWGVALAVALLATQGGVAGGLIDLNGAAFQSRDLHVAGAALGGLLFGFGMTLAGTCSFGLLVRAGSGDLRAGMTALVVGIFAFAATSGLLAPFRVHLASIGTLSTGPAGGQTSARTIAAITFALMLLALPVFDRRLRRRPRLLLGSALLGLAVAAGWALTGRAVEALTLDRPESLSFVAPVGRALLQFMMEPFRNIGFGVAAMLGVLVASGAVSTLRGELRWEAFDDPTEMRRHLFGAALMGIGGVVGQGCTIGQGLSAASTLALSAPIFVAGVLTGARLGLWHLIDGWPPRWRK